MAINQMRPTSKADGDGRAAAGRWTFTALGTRYREYGLVAVLVLEMAVCAFASPSFLTTTNIINITRAAAAIGIIAVGMTFVVLTAGIDLSVGGAVSLVGMVIASSLSSWENAVVAVVVALAAGAVIGLFNGFLVAKFRVPALIVTLGTMYLLTSGAQLWNNGGPLPVRNATLQSLGSNYVGPIPVPVIVWAVVVLIGWWLLNQTRFGRHVYAVGGGFEAAKLTGIRIDRVLIGVYVISGVLAALASLLYVGRLATASPLTGDGLELQVIASVVVGGVSLFGGRGNLRDTVVGVLILTVLQNGLNLVGVSGFFQTMSLGAALLIAVLLSPEADLKGHLLSLVRKGSR